MNKSVRKSIEAMFNAMRDNNRIIAKLSRYKQNCASSAALVKVIAEQTEKSATIEDLLDLEMYLQRMDLLLAEKDSDRKNAETAQRQYSYVSETITQMRTQPHEYMQMNCRSKEADGDPQKICPSFVLKHLNANRERLQKRISFAALHLSDLWSVRIKLTNRAIEKYRELHLQIANEHRKAQD